MEKNEIKCENCGYNEWRLYITEDGELAAKCVTCEMKGVDWWLSHWNL